MSKIAVIGSGAWGIGIATHLARKGHDVTVWAHSREAAEALRATRHLAAFPDVVLPENIHYTSELEEAAKDRDLIVFSVASPFTRTTAKRIRPFIRFGQIITAVTKGVEEETFCTQTEILAQEIPSATVTALSGPTHAEEVVIGLPTTIVSAGEEKAARFVQDVFMSPEFRVYTSDDVLGVELGGSLKNVIALAAGMADGLGNGDNCKAAIITRGIHEMARLSVKMGARAETLYGLSGIGDLIVTCASMHSRNRRCGILIGQGKSMDEAVKEVGQVVEGIYSAKSALGLAGKYEVELPITEEVNHVLFDGKKPSEALRDLMQRDKKSEN